MSEAGGRGLAYALVVLGAGAWALLLAGGLIWLAMPGEPGVLLGFVVRMRTFFSIQAVGLGAAALAAASLLFVRRPRSWQLVTAGLAPLVLSLLGIGTLWLFATFFRG